MTGQKTELARQLLTACSDIRAALRDMREGRYQDILDHIQDVLQWAWDGCRNSGDPALATAIPPLGQTRADRLTLFDSLRGDVRAMSEEMAARALEALERAFRIAAGIPVGQVTAEAEAYRP